MKYILLRNNKNNRYIYYTFNDLPIQEYGEAYNSYRNSIFNILQKDYDMCGFYGTEWHARYWKDFYNKELKTKSHILDLNFY